MYYFNIAFCRYNFLPKVCDENVWIVWRIMKRLKKLLIVRENSFSNNKHGTNSKMGESFASLKRAEQKRQSEQIVQLPFFYYFHTCCIFYLPFCTYRNFNQFCYWVPNFFHYYSLVTIGHGTLLFSFHICNCKRQNEKPAAMISNEIANLFSTLPNNR